jgi:hypothetical protein
MTSTESTKAMASRNLVVSLAATVLTLACLQPASAQLPPAPPAAAPQDTPAPRPLFEHWRIYLDTGARNYDLYGDHPGRFLEKRDVTRGFFMNGLGIRFESADSPYSFRFNAADIRELDETIKADLWKVGTFRTTFLWDRLPRYYSTGTSLFHSAAPGVLLVSPAIRAAFQSIVDGQPAQLVPAALAPFVRNELASAPVSDLRVRREQAGLRQSVQFGHLKLHVQAKGTLHRGTRPKGLGTFARQGNGPNGDGVWEAIASELPEPVQYRTTDFKAGGVLSGAKWRFGFDYGFTLFRNNVGTLAYQNPFRVTDNVGQTAAGANCPGYPPNTPGVILPCPGSAIGRNRFVTQQIALPPDTNYHSVTGWWGFDLPRTTQFRGLISWGQSSQNDPFLAFTQNAALNGTTPGFADNLPAGVSVTSLVALPQRSLNGEVRNINADSALVSRPWKNMNFRLQYRVEDMKDKTPSIVIPGFSRFGDSHWVNALDYYKIPIRNIPASFTKQDAIASWEWDLASWATFEAEYQFETWRRTGRDAPRTNENSFRGQLDFKLPRNAKFVADYTLSMREAEFYRTANLAFNPNLRDTSPTGLAFGPGWEITDARVPFLDPTVPLEFNQLRRYDQASRRRYDGKVALDIPVSEKVGFSTSYRYTRNNYEKGFYGLRHDLMASVDSEITLAVGERAFLYLDYSREFQGYRYLGLGHLICGTQPGGSCAGGAPANVNACCAMYPIANTWDRSSRSSLDGAHFGLNWASDGEKTTIDLSYGYSYAKDRIHTFNPYPILVGSPRTAGTYDYPDARNRSHELLFSLSRKLRPGLDLGVEYRFQSYQLDDFFLNNLQPYPQGLITAGGIPINLHRNLLLNARFGTYHAHQEGVFLKYSF